MPTTTTKARQSSASMQHTPLQQTSEFSQVRIQIVHAISSWHGCTTSNAEFDTTITVVCILHSSTRVKENGLAGESTETRPHRSYFFVTVEVYTSSCISAPQPSDQAHWSRENRQRLHAVSPTAHHHRLPQKSKEQRVALVLISI